MLLINGYNAVKVKVQQKQKHLPIKTSKKNDTTKVDLLPDLKKNDKLVVTENTKLIDYDKVEKRVTIGALIIYEGSRFPATDKYEDLLLVTYERFQGFIKTKYVRRP